MMLSLLNPYFASCSSDGFIDSFSVSKVVALVIADSAATFIIGSFYIFVKDLLKIYYSCLT